MQLDGNTVLLTGGSSGIGAALAVRLLARGNEVIITGRREDALRAFQAQHPKVHIKVNDAGNADARVELAAWVTQRFPRLNVLINNAGIQRKLDVRAAEPWSDTAQEIDINLGGPIHLASLLIPHLAQQPVAHILNVTSGLAFVPRTHIPVYCATKAALHSYTLSLRHQLAATSIRVTEIIPPAVKTNLGGAHDFGEELDVYADSVIAQLEQGLPETTFGLSANVSQASRGDLDRAFERMNAPGFFPEPSRK